jgi:hypothetical protein
MGKMPGQGALPPHVVADMIREAKARGKCADVSTLGYICTEEAGHFPLSPHKGTDPQGNVKDVWMASPGAWDADAACSIRANMLRDKAAKADKLAESFTVFISRLEATPGYDFVKAWEKVLGLVEAMPGRLTAQDGMELLAYFITRLSWSDPDTIPRGVRDE